MCLGVLTLLLIDTVRIPVIATLAWPNRALEQSQNSRVQEDELDLRDGEQVLGILTM